MGSMGLWRHTPTALVWQYPPRPLTASYHSASPPSPERYTGLTLSIQAVRFSSYPFQLRSILILDFVFFSVHIFVASAVLPVFCHQTHLSSGNHCLCLVLLGLKRILHNRCHSPLTTSAPMANRPVETLIVLLLCASRNLRVYILEFTGLRQLVVDPSSLVGRVMIDISWKRYLKFGRGRVSAASFPSNTQDSKFDEVQLIWRASVLCVG